MSTLQEKDIIHFLAMESNIGLFSCDEHGIFLFFNKKVTEIFGCDATTLKEKGWLGFLVDESGNILKAWKSAILAGQEFQNECQIICQGESKWVFVHIKPIEHEGVFSGYAGTLFDISPLKSQQEKLVDLANQDPLTRLANRRLFFIMLNQFFSSAQRHNTDFAVMFVDIDHFKRVNDIFGHQVGDSILRQVAKRLCKVARGSDFVARYGGDEFVILLEGNFSKELLILIAKRFMKEFEKPFFMDAKEYHVTVSVGVSTLSKDTESSEKLLRQADDALYDAKKSGRNLFKFYSADLNESLSKQYEIEMQLSGAKERGEFSLNYQPQFNLKTKRITGIEALLRWNNSVLGNVPPKEFIPLTEESNYIMTLGLWVIEEVFHQLALWKQEAPEIFDEMRVSINLSSNQLIPKNFPNQLKKLSEENNISPNQISFELTETALMTERCHSYEAIKKISELGFHIVIDDFGTSASSLSYLRQLPSDSLKVDRSFILDINHNASNVIIKAIISLAKALELKVIAEGTENEEQLKFLETHDCDYVQGYYLCKPLPPHELIEFIKKYENEHHR